MGLSIRTFPDDILSSPCEEVLEVNEEVRSLAREMIATLPLSQGIGLAAPQVGRSLRLFVADIWWPQSGTTDKAMTFINPKLKFGAKVRAGMEGCLSLPGLHTPVLRATSVTVEATGLDGLPFTLEAEGLLAIVIQHEFDHLDGVLMIDRRSRV